MIFWTFLPSLFSEDYQETEIKEAMDVYMKETCLVFRPATSRDVNKIYFQNGGGG